MNSVSTKDCTNTASTVAFVILPIRRDTIRFNFAIMHLRCTAACEITLGHAELVWFNVGNGAAKNVCERVRFLYRWQSEEEWKKCQLRMACAQSWWNTFERTKYLSVERVEQKNDEEATQKDETGGKRAGRCKHIHSFAFLHPIIIPFMMNETIFQMRSLVHELEIVMEELTRAHSFGCRRRKQKKKDGKNNGIEAKMRQVSVCECSREEKNAPEYLIAAF